MKKHCIAFLFLLLVVVCTLQASPVYEMFRKNDEVVVVNPLEVSSGYRSFTINGESVNRWVEIDNITEYDAKGNEIHYKNSDGYEWWSEYDAKGNEIHYKNSDGDERWYEYEANGN